MLQSALAPDQPALIFTSVTSGYWIAIVTWEIVTEFAALASFLLHILTLSSEAFVFKFISRTIGIKSFYPETPVWAEVNRRNCNLCIVTGSKENLTQFSTVNY